MPATLPVFRQSVFRQSVFRKSVLGKAALAAALLTLAACQPYPNWPNYGYGGGSYGGGSYGGAPVYSAPVTSGYGAPVYRTTTRHATSTRSGVMYGQVVGAQRVGGGGGNTGLAGATIGGLAGGLAGRQIGGGSGRDVATAIGAVGGALIGQQMATQRAAPSQMLWTIRLDDGRTVSVPYGGGLSIGQRVAVSWQNGQAVIVG